MKERISGKLNDYLIKKDSNGFYAEVRTRNKLQLLKEYFTDWIGDTYIHPKFLNTFYFSSIESIKWLINIHMKFEYGRKKTCNN